MRVSFSVAYLLFCETCGAPLNSGEVFCSNCGEPVRQGDVSPRPKRTVTMGTIFLAIIVFAAGVALGSYFAPPSPSGSQELQPIMSISISPTTFTSVTTAQGETSTETITITTEQKTTIVTTRSATSSVNLYSSSTTYRPTTTARSNCDPSYPTVCIPPPPPDLDCKDIQYRNFVVLPPDPHHFDGDGDGIGCET
jgi:predicted nucleic acid-binding Zn ribbon protein